MENIIGKQLGPYEIVAPLGEGGMASVYKGYQPGVDRFVAVKVLPQRLADDPQFIGRFQQEAKILAQLQHPHILPVFDFGESEGYTYIVMPYLPEGTLADMLHGTPLPLPQCATIISQLADALDYAHDKGLLHRDIKPSNVLIDERGNCLLTDFGIAKMFASTAHYTITGGIMGTPDYMSPEQGLGKELDRRSDVYSLGVMLYELVTGRVPFRAETPVATVMKHIYEPLPTPRLINHALPENVEKVILRALAKEPDHRYATAGALAQALNDAIAGKDPDLTIIERPAVPPPQPTRPVRAKQESSIWKWLLPLVLILAVLLLIGSIGLFSGFFRGSADETPVASGSASTAESTATAKPSATATATAVPPTEAPPTVEPTAEPAEAIPIIPASDPTVHNGDIYFHSNRDGDYEIYKVDASGDNLVQLTNNTADDQFPRVSPDGRQILFQSDRDGDVEIYVMDSNGTNQTRLTAVPGLDQLPAWSPDGRSIIFSSNRADSASPSESDLYVMDSFGRSQTKLEDTPEFEAHPSWSVDSRLAFNVTEVGTDYWQIYTASSDGSGRTKITNTQVDEWSPEWSPDGRYILFLSERDNPDNPGIYIMAADGRNPQLVHNEAGEEWGQSWSPDGTQIIFAVDQPDNTADIFVMNVDGSDAHLLIERGGYPSWAPLPAAGAVQPQDALPGQDQIRLTFRPELDYTPSLSPDQTQMAFATEIDGLWQIALSDPNQDDRANLKILTSGSGNYQFPQFAPDGTSILVTAELDGDADLYLLDPTTGAVIQQITDFPGKEITPRWFPDGQAVIFTGYMDGEEEIYSINIDGSNLRQLTTNTVFDGFPAVSPDGQHIAYYANPEGDYEIYIANSDGTNPQRLTNVSGRDASPTFSPDGQWIVFESNRDGDHDIYAMHTDGSEVQNLTNNDSSDYFPSISPDGQWLFFQSNMDGEMNIYRRRWPYAAEVSTNEPLVEPNGVSACTLTPGQTVTAGANTRLWSEADVLSGSAIASIASNAQLTILDGPQYGRVRSDVDISGWWWLVDSGGEQGWIWQGRINECAD